MILNPDQEYADTSTLLTSMKLKELKQQVYECWRDLSAFNGALVQDAQFKPEVRQFGDLRRKSTWQKAYTVFWAKNIYDSCLDAWMLCTRFFNYSPNQWDYELRFDVFDEFLKLPEGLDLIRQGLEQLYSSDFNDKDRSNTNGFFELAEGWGRQQQQLGLAAEPVGRLLGGYRSA